MIEIARRRQRPGSGTDADFLRARTTNMRMPDLSDALSGIPWAVVGAVATRMYMPERVTGDLDVPIAAADSLAARDRLTNSGARHRGELAFGRSQWRLADDYPLDMIEIDEPWSREALRDAEQNRDGQGLPILPLPYLVLLKVRASRLQDVADASRMLGLATDAQFAATREVFD